MHRVTPRKRQQLSFTCGAELFQETPFQCEHVSSECARTLREAFAGLLNVALYSSRSSYCHAKPNDDAILLLDDELSELVDRAEIGVGDQIHRDHRSLRAAQRRQIVVARQRLAQHRQQATPTSTQQKTRQIHFGGDSREA